MRAIYHYLTDLNLASGAGGEGIVASKGGRGGDIGAKNRGLAFQDFAEAGLGAYIIVSCVH